MLYVAVCFSGPVTGAATGEWEFLLNDHRRRADVTQQQQQQQPKYIFLTERKAT